MGGGAPLPHAASDNVGQGEMQSVAGGQACVRSSFCEVAEKESVLVAKIKEGGAVVHALSGRVNTRVAENFRPGEGCCEAGRDRLVAHYT